MNWLELKSFGWRKISTVTAGTALAGIVIKAFLLFVVIPYFINASPTTYRANAFPDQYDFIAMNLLQGHGYRIYPETAETMLRTPGFVVVLAGIFSVFGHSLAATKVFNLVFSIVTACVVYALAKRITDSHRLGIIAAAFTFFYPGLLLADSRGGVESLFTMLVALLMLLTYRAIQSEAIRDYLLVGLVFGLLLTIKSSVGLFPLFLFAYLLAAKPSVAGVRDAVTRVGALAVVAAAVLSPWIIRNYAISNEFVPTATIVGPTSHATLYLLAHRHTGREHYVLLEEAAAEQELLAQQMGLKFRPGFFLQFYTSRDELIYSDHLVNVIKTRYSEEPTLLIDSIVFNLHGFWFQGRTNKATLQNYAIVLPFLAAVFWGMYVGWRQALAIGPLLLFIASFILAHLLVMGVARYHVPLTPLLAVLAFIPLRAVIGDVSNRVTPAR